jgi:hypothetical protein
MDDRGILRQMLDDVRFWRTNNWRMSENGTDVTDSWIADKLSRARHLWRVITAREARES